MSIRDWGIVEKIQRKLEKNVSFENIFWNFEKKKIEEYSEKNLAEILKIFKKIIMELR